jgi:glucose-6-phosphate-specific signal transduction histidine kinase
MSQFNKEYGAALRFGSSLELILENNYPPVSAELHTQLNYALTAITKSALLMKYIEEGFEKEMNAEACQNLAHKIEQVLRPAINENDHA